MRTRERESTLQVEGRLCLGSESGEGGISDRAGKGELFRRGKTIKKARFNWGPLNSVGLLYVALYLKI